MCGIVFPSLHNNPPKADRSSTRPKYQLRGAEGALDVHPWRGGSILLTSSKVQNIFHIDCGMARSGLGLCSLAADDDKPPNTHDTKLKVATSGKLLETHVSNS